ncbi:uncharacterized protein LOC134855007 [Symsagittifera roscoffensis]|uniref:uncharacterized protein LOC134855007 n=1 Tax=Symsagittifera roscoffensis TaxID=84072 RepID=UPI00307BCFD7
MSLFSFFALVLLKCGITFSIFADLTDWKSMIFVLPNLRIEGAHRSCAELGYLFCYIGFVVDSRQSPRIPHSFDYAQFYQLIRPVHKKINWISLSQRNAFERGGCCHDQTEIYQKYGQRNGMTPLEYSSNATDFRSRRKKLNVVEVGEFSLKFEFSSNASVKEIEYSVSVQNSPILNSPKQSGKV